MKLNDIKYMKLAVELAEKGAGRVNPNPMVGAVIVKDDIILAEGYHQSYGGLHAERNALAACGGAARGSTLYVTLEPCCHYGKTPPCTQAVIESGIGRVVIGTLDPNPVVAGNGVKLLRSHGIQVDTGILESECQSLIKVFTHYITTQKPYVILKYAMTMDGKIATRTNQSKWITGSGARRHVHENRNRCSAVMAGVGTVLNDDPLLTCRLAHSRNPVRIICDTNLRTPLTSQIVRTANEADTILATCAAETKKYRAYQEAGCRVITVPRRSDHVDLSELMSILGTMEIDSIILEGGSTLNWSALNQGIVNCVQAYIAPKLFGGEKAKTPVGGSGVDLPSHAFELKNTQIIKIGDDFLMESEVVYPCLPE